MALSQDFYKSSLTQNTGLTNNIYGGIGNPYDREGAFGAPVDNVSNPGGVIDFLGSSLWGAASGITFGLTEYINPYAATPWEEKSGAEKSGAILGEGLSLFLPFGAFGVMGKGLRGATKLAGANKFIGKASESAVKGFTQKSIHKTFDPDTAKDILDGARNIAKTQNISLDAALRTYGDDVVKGLNNVSKSDIGTGWVRGLNSQGTTVHNATKQLNETGAAAISKAFDDAGIALDPRQARRLAGDWVEELKGGKYVNDVAEWVERGLAGQAPGAVREKVSMYLGMATQDMIMMTAHGMISGAIKADATGEHFDYSESLSHSAMMALAFPLIRAVGPGGKDNLTTGFNAYFKRFRNTNYKKIAEEQGEGSVRNLLRLMVTDKEKRSIWNKNIGADSWWTVGKGSSRKVYNSAKDIEANINEMPMDHVFTLLKKINVKISNDMLGKWGPKYLADFAASVPRMVGGTLVTNPWMMNKDAWGSMDSEELGSHVMMSFMMTKGKGAWNKSAKQMYYKDFTPHIEAMNILGVNSKQAGFLNTMSEFQKFNIADGNTMLATNFGKQLVDSFDTVIKDVKESNPTAKHSSTNPDLLLVQQFAGAYDNMKLSVDRNHVSVVDQVAYMSDATLSKIATNIKRIQMGPEGKVVQLDSYGKDMFWEGMIAMTGEQLNSGMKHYRNMFADLNALGFDIQMLSDGKIEWTATRTKKEGDSNIGRMTEINNILKIFEKNGDANPERAKGSQQEMTMERVAARNQLTMNELQAKVSATIDYHMENLAQVSNQRGSYLRPDQNTFIDFYSGAKSVATNDRLYKIITGKATNETDNNITRLLDQLFVVNKTGRYAHNITDYLKAIENWKDLSGAKEGSDAYNKYLNAKELLQSIEPWFQMRKVHKGGGMSETPRKNSITIESLDQASTQLRNIFSSLPAEFQSNFNSRIKQVYMDRILHNKGMDSRALNLAEFIVSNRLGLYRDGDVYIPSVEAFKQMLTDKQYSKDEIAKYEVALKTIQDVMGNTVKITQDVPVDSNGKSLRDGVNITDYMKAYDLLANETITNLMITSKGALENLNKSLGGNNKRLAEVQSKITNIIDYVDPSKSREGSSIKDLMKEVESVVKELNLISEASKNGAKDAVETQTTKDVNDMILTLDVLVKNLDKASMKWNRDLSTDAETMGKVGQDVTVDPFGLISTIREPIQRKVEAIFEREVTAQNQLREIVNKLENLTLRGRAGYGIDKYDTASIIDNLTKEWNQLYTKEKNKPKKTLSELIEVTNEGGLFGDAVKVFQKVQEEINFRVILNNKDHAANENLSKMRESLESGKGEKVERHKSPMEILKEYGLVNKDNRVDERFKTLALSGGVNSHKAMNDYIFNQKINNMTDGDGKPLSSTKKAKLWDNFREKHAFEILNYLENQTLIPTVKIVAAGEGNRAVTIFNNDKVATNYPNVSYFNKKGFKALFLEDSFAIESFGRLRNVSLDMQYSNPNLITDLINTSLRTSAKSKELISSLKDNFKISESEVLEMLKDKNISKNFHYVRLSPSNRMLFVATQKNIELLNKDFNTFYESTVKRLQQENKLTELKSFEYIFGDLKNKTADEMGARHLVELKLMLPFLDVQGSRQNFDKYLLEYSKGEPEALAKVQANLFKRGYLTDGGTTQPISKRALEYAAIKSDVGFGKQYGYPNDNVRNQANKILNQRGYKIAVFDESNVVKGEDYSHPLNIKGLVIQDLTSKLNQISQKQTKTKADEIQESILNAHLNESRGIKSLDNSLFDGAKFASLDMMRLVMAQKGLNIGDFVNQPNGAKTIIFSTGETQLLGKGYLIYHPEVAKNMGKDVDIAIGSESAKSFSGKSTRKGFNIQPLNVKKGLTSLINAQDNNKMIIPIESIGVSFMSKNAEGGVISSSIFDFQNSSTVRSAIDWMNFKSTYEQIATEWKTVQNDPGGYMKWMYKINKEAGNQLDRGDNNLARLVAEYGADPNTPLVIPALKRMMRNQHYKELSSVENHRGGEDNFLIPNVAGDLKSPVFISLANNLGDRVHRLSAQYGESSINKNQANRTLGRTEGQPSISGETFIFRDKNGLDVIIRYRGKGKYETESPVYNEIIANKDLRIAGENAQGAKKYYEKNDLKDFNYSKNSQKDVERVLGKINDLTIENSLTYKNVIDLLKNQRINISNGRGGFKTIRLDYWAKKLADDYNLAFGMLGHAIPAIGHDKVMFRVGKVLEQMNGLAEVNAFDLRVAMQRDNDGDHFYMHQKLPFELVKSFARENGKKVDYNMFNTGHVLNGKYVDIFGIGESGAGKAGDVPTSVGFQQYANTLSLAKRAVGTIIGSRNAISWLDRLGFQIKDSNGKSQRFLKNFSDPNKLTIDSPEWKWLTKFYDTMQNSVDIHGGIHELLRFNKSLEDFLFYGKVEESAMSTAVSNNQRGLGDKVLNRHIINKESVFGENNKNFGQEKVIEREIFREILRTLKKVNMVQNDVYDEAGSRNPEPADIKYAFNDLNYFFTNPTEYLATKMAKVISRKKRNNDPEANLLFQEYQEMFFKDRTADVSVEANRKALYKDLMKGWTPNLPKKMFSFSNIPVGEPSSLAAMNNPFYQSIGGYHMLQLNNLRAFHTKTFEGLKRIQGTGENQSLFKSAGIFVNRIENFVETIKMFGDDPVAVMKGISSKTGDYEFNINLSSFGVPDGSNINYKKNINNGILRSLIERQHKELTGSLNYFREEKFTNPNKLENIKSRLENLQSAMDIMDIQMTRDMVIDNPTNQIIKGGKGKSTKSIQKKLLGKQQVAIWSIKGDVKASDKKKINSLGDYVVEGQVVDHKQLKFIGYFNKDSKNIDLYKGNTYIVDKNPKKLISMSDNELKWNRALFKATYGEETSDFFIKEPGRIEEFKRDLKMLRIGISTGYRSTIKEALSSKVLSKDIYAMSNVREFSEIQRFINKWENEIDSPHSIGPVDFLLRSILKPQLAATYASDDVGNYVPNFESNRHLQQTVLQFALEGNHGKNKGFVEPFIKQVMDYYHGRKSMELSEYDKAHNNEKIDYDKLGNAKYPHLSMLKYLGVFYASPEMEYQMALRANKGENRIQMGRGADGEQIPFRTSRPIKAQPKDWRGKYPHTEEGKGC